ncbi:MAG: TonB-dependent receptor [Bryobacteraceae bacterium]
MTLARAVTALLLSSGAAHAQSIFGEIRGTVIDATGSLVGSASVEATKAATGEIRRTESDPTGVFSLVNLDAGSYEIKVQKAGFRTSVTRNVVLRAREIARIDVSLEVAPNTTEVQVSEAAQVIQLEMSTIMDSKSANELNKLPVNYRAGSTNSFYAIISTSPNVQPDSGGSYAVGGTMPFMATASVDGISNVNVRSNGVLTEMFPTADTVDEVRVSSTSNNAEFAQAGDITVTSKSGTNAFHGTGYWYHQNGAFDARDFFASRTPFKVSNDYGMTLGGPVLKNRTFFFGAYEGLKFRAQSIVNTTVPPASFRSGDLSAVTQNLRDPFNSNQPFAGAAIPTSRIAPASRTLMQALFPLPTRDTGNIASTNYQLQEPVKNDNDQFDIRVDHNVSAAHRVFGRISKKDISRTSPTSLPGTLGQRVNSLDPINFVVAYNWVARPTLLNEFRFGWARQQSLFTFGVNGQTFDGPGLLKTAGILGVRSDPPKGSQVPDIQINGIQGTGQGREGVTRSRTWQFADNVTWLRGRHTWKFGADIRRLNTTDITSFFTGDDMGTYAFNGQFTGQSFGDFLLGVPQQTTLANTGPDVDGITNHIGFFAQDDFRVNSKLTMNFGVRYEVHPMFYDRALTTSQFDRAFPGPGARVVIANEAARKVTSPAFLASIGNTPVVLAKEVGLPETLRYNDYNNFMPRFGFAFRPFGNNKTVLRGGYGIYTATVLGSVFYTITGIHVSDARTFPNQLVNGVPALAFPRAFGTGLGALGVPDFRRATQWDGADPYTQQWNLTAERELPYQTGLRITYAGSRSIKLFSSPDLNQVRANSVGFATARLNRPYPVWNIVYTRDPNTGVWFNSFTGEFHKRYSKGLFFQTSYVWAKNLSNSIGSDGTGFASENGSVPTDRFNQRLDYGNVAGARRHRWLTTFTYDLPFQSLLKANKASQLLAGGWQLSGILLVQSGSFLTPVTGNVTDPSGTGLSTRANNRPDWTGTSYGNLGGDARTVTSWWDRGAFSIPGLGADGRALANNGAIGRFGYAAPGSLVGPGTATMSLKIQKRFPITERVFAQLEGSAANLTNTPNFGFPNRNVSVAQFGRITSTQGVENAGSRNLQIGLRVGF